MINDTDDGHTFTIQLPSSQPNNFQFNNSLIGQIDARNDHVFTTPASNCLDQNGNPAACQTTGSCFDNSGTASICQSPAPNGYIAMITAKGSFTVSVPGVYRYYCIYHQNVGMFGWLVVLPNKGYPG